jgi:FkbM family methyltransferase
MRDLMRSALARIPLANRLARAALVAGDDRFVTDLDAARRAAHRYKDALGRSRAAYAEARHRVPSTIVVSELFPARAAAARARAARDAARARHQQHLRDSESYRQAVDKAGEPPQKAAAIELGGLEWWIPQNSAAPERTDRALKQGLPLRALLQTREASVGPVMLDIGANIGRTSITRAVYGDVGIVFAAEPDPDNYDSLVRTLVRNALTGLVVPDQFAIGDSDGEVRLVRAKYIGGHAVREVAPAKRDSVNVAVRTVDRWMTERRIDPVDVAFVKVDVQGFEPRVLRGAASLLAHPHVAWQFEVDPAQLKAAGASLPELLDLFERFFTRAVDFNRAATGERVQPVATLRESLAYLDRGVTKTDVLVYRHHQA